MRKITALLVALITLFIFASCGSGETGEPEAAEYDGELFGPVAVGDGEENVFVGVDTSFIHVFRESDTKIPYQSFTTSGFDDVADSARSIIAADATSDGYTDLIIPFRRVDDHQYYYVYVWNADSKGYVFVPSMSSVGNIEVKDGHIKGFASEHGAYVEKEYYFENGDFAAAEEDEGIATAREYAQGLLGKDSFTLTFARDELIDMALTRLYFVTEGEEVTAYIAVTYDNSRAFYSPVSDVYFEIVRRDDGYKKGESFSRMEYTGEVTGYKAEAFSKLSENQKEYYDMIAEKLRAYDEVDFESADAAAAMDAYMKDNPVTYLYFVPETEGYSVKGRYCYTWDNYDYDVSLGTLSEKVAEYSERISAVVGEMPTGLEPIEKYVYLAQKLRSLSEEEHHEGKENGMSVYIPGESLNERAAKTYAYMCEKAELYCTWDGGTNYIMDGGKVRPVHVYDAYPFPGGSDEWFEVFFAEEEK